MTPVQLPVASPVIHYGAANKPPIPQRPFPANPNLLSPDAAFYAHAPVAQEQPRQVEGYAQGIENTLDGSNRSLRSDARSPKRGRDGARSRSRRGKGVWRKLLWVKQKEYPDNYTDPPTFLSKLQRNPRLRPYDFWPLVADSTVIVQHISSVAIFVCSFVGIYQRRVSPVSVATGASIATFLGWILWDIWMGQEESLKHAPETHTLGQAQHNNFANGSTFSVTSSAVSTPAQTPSGSTDNGSTIGLGLVNLSTTSLPPNRSKGHHLHDSSHISVETRDPSPTLSRHPSHINLHESYRPPPTPYLSRSRIQQRATTVKSAILIYTALLGLSPILKSLTESTSSDSIWALSTWLMLLHVFFFDYSGPSSSSSSSPLSSSYSSSSTTATATTTTSTTTTNNSAKFPASLSTNAALMASTVLASRLPSTTHVFSLTLFSIEVFGLFPVWRRCLRHVSWRGHLLLTLILVLGAGAGLGLVISGRRVWSEGGWKQALAGSVVWGVVSVVGMGGCSWWLIGLQRYKNVVIGPWDPARPIIRRGGWE